MAGSRKPRRFGGSCSNVVPSAVLGVAVRTQTATTSKADRAYSSGKILFEVPVAPTHARGLSVEAGDSCCPLVP